LTPLQTKPFTTSLRNCKYSYEKARNIYEMCEKSRGEHSKVQKAEQENALSRNFSPETSVTDTAASRVADPKRKKNIEVALLFGGELGKIERLYDVESYALAMDDVAEKKVVNILKAKKRLGNFSCFTPVHPHDKRTVPSVTDIETFLRSKDCFESFTDSVDEIQVLNKTEDIIRKLSNLPDDKFEVEIKKIMSKLNECLENDIATNGEYKRRYNKLRENKAPKEEFDELEFKRVAKVFNAVSLGSCEFGFVYDIINKKSLKNYLAINSKGGV
jgi:hypothetical protein